MDPRFISAAPETVAIMDENLVEVMPPPNPIFKVGDIVKTIADTTAGVRPKYAESFNGIIDSQEYSNERGCYLIKIKSMHSRVSIVAREDEVLPVSESQNDSINID